MAYDAEVVRSCVHLVGKYGEPFGPEGTSVRRARYRGLGKWFTITDSTVAGERTIYVVDESGRTSREVLKHRNGQSKADVWRGREWQALVKALAKSDGRGTDLSDKFK